MSSAFSDVVVMSSVKQRYQDISPVTLQLVGGAVSSSLYCGEVEGLSGGLVESFMVELYRCKLCQFTCGLKASISSHLQVRHRPPTLTYLGEGNGGGGAVDREEAGLRQGVSPYQFDLNGESKQSDEDEDFLLYNMLDNMSPPTCDISSEGGLQVSTLFEEESSMFPLKGASVDLSLPIDPPATQEEMAQSAHLMTLGLCRISAAKPPPPNLPPPLPPPPPTSSRPPLEPHWRRRRRRRREEQKQEEKKKKKKKASASLQFICPVCLRRFRSSASRRAHQQTHRGHSDGWRSRLIGRAGGTEADRPDSQTSRHLTDSPLSVTEKKKKKKSRSKEGEEKQSNQTGFCCSLCHRKFSTKLTLRRHLGTHGDDKPFTCPTCSYSSRLKASLLQHLRTHTGEKPYRCTECPYASIDRSSLLRHSRTHSQEKPYRCQHCDYSSIQKKSLDLHARRHHTGEAFPCQQCEYSSPDRQLLLRHVRRHHACDLTADQTL
ncbi:zinc finger protein 69 isoform X2 [Cebidichthys violaceus]|uniref:zinc finger protein 69 isoform X2 n=1 Tax=Cebidichthys violaceus TaxID=271503 RepID=UPI0035CA7976